VLDLEGCCWARIGGQSSGCVGTLRNFRHNLDGTSHEGSQGSIVRRHPTLEVGSRRAGVVSIDGGCLSHSEHEHTHFVAIIGSPFRLAVTAKCFRLCSEAGWLASPPFDGDLTSARPTIWPEAGDPFLAGLTHLDTGVGIPGRWNRCHETSRRAVLIIRAVRGTDLAIHVRARIAPIAGDVSRGRHEGRSERTAQPALSIQVE